MEREFLQNCQDNNLEGVNDCLSRGVDVNSKEDWYGCVLGPKMTALMIACEYGNPTIVSRLVQVPGLDINYQDRERDIQALHKDAL